MNRSALRWVLGLALLAVVGMAVAWRDRFDATALQTWVENAGAAGPLGGGEGTIRNMLIALALFAAVAFLAHWVRKLRVQTMLDIETLKRQLYAREDVLVLDVRGASDFAADGGHIPGARNLTLEELPPRLAELEDRKQRAIRLVCRTDRPSAQAARLLADAGHPGWGAGGKRPAVG